MKNLFLIPLFIGSFVFPAISQQSNSNTRNVIEDQQTHASPSQTNKPSFTEYPLNTVEKAPDMNEDTDRGMNAPSLRVYFPSPEKATGSMVIALPGGGYSNLALFHEGYDWAPFYLDKGIAFGVLKYRMPQTDYTIPFADVKAAFDQVKEHATVWKINPKNIGIMGASAGGHLASTYATHTEGEDKPAFQILLYPVISMDTTFTHAGSRRNLLGEKPSDRIGEQILQRKKGGRNHSACICYFCCRRQSCTTHQWVPLCGGVDRTQGSGYISTLSDWWTWLRKPRFLSLQGSVYARAIQMAAGAVINRKS